MKKRREINAFSISFLDLLSGALGAVIILYVAIPKNVQKIEIPQIDLEKEVIKKDNQVLKDQVSEAQKKISELQKQIEELQKIKEVSKEVVTIEEQKAETKAEGPNLDVGFKFKGKRVVFLVDASQSMEREDRMGQVRAGLKMLLTSMPSSFEIEIIQFPFGMRAPFKTLWGVPTIARKFNKLDAFDFLARITPYGSTPTRDALLFVLNNYQDISDIVLLTDGVPTFHNSNKKDDIYDILAAVRSLNTNKIQINTVGVGTNFLSDQTSDQYKFLSLLAEETNGFFVGF